MASIYEKEMAAATKNKDASLSFRGKNYSTGIQQTKTGTRKGVRSRNPLLTQVLDEIWTPKEIDE